LTPGILESCEAVARGEIRARSIDDRVEEAIRALDTIIKGYRLVLNVAYAIVEDATETGEAIDVDASIGADDLAGQCAIAGVKSQQSRACSSLGDSYAEWSHTRGKRLSSSNEKQ
jgi:hypothetical protein